jgi:hypothetical protein
VRLLGNQEPLDVTLGHVLAVVRSIDDARDELRRLGVPTREMP